MELNDNLYVYEDVIFTEKQLKAFEEKSGTTVEPEYTYFTPDVYELWDNYSLIVNFEETMCEWVENVDGITKSIGVIRNSELIRAMINLAVSERLK